MITPKRSSTTFQITFTNSPLPADQLAASIGCAAINDGGVVSV